ncbi:hypothetical protein E2C01_085265 [Portunus trituberculatus]|uniref:Uncharacterized protein n=1 Tax=Portunus trituberculatus TaxID=210409 RepID=A0A5B7JBG4_PORTR|nr:hypothetical protein [Portunus trituberculatus]
MRLPTTAPVHLASWHAQSLAALFTTPTPHIAPLPDTSVRPRRNKPQPGSITVTSFMHSNTFATAGSHERQPRQQEIAR